MLLRPLWVLRLMVLPRRLWVLCRRRGHRARLRLIPRLLTGMVRVILWLLRITRVPRVVPRS